MPEGQEHTLPSLCYGLHAAAAQEDASCVEHSPESSDSWSLFAVAGGHNGPAAATCVRAFLRPTFRAKLRSGSRSAGGGGGKSGRPKHGPGAQAVRQALAQTFLTLDHNFCASAPTSGCALTTAVISGRQLTVANVGDSLAILDTGRELIQLTTSHRLADNAAERARLLGLGAQLARASAGGGGPSGSMDGGVGPLRLWPGGLTDSRSIGDPDTDKNKLAHPALKQVIVPAGGARLILATRGLWDAVPAGQLAHALRTTASPQAAAQHAVGLAVQRQGGGAAHADVTVCVVDLLPPGTSSFLEVCCKAAGNCLQMCPTPAGSSPPLGCVQPAAARQQAGRAGRAAKQQRSRLLDCFRPASGKRKGGPGQLAREVFAPVGAAEQQQQQRMLSAPSLELCDCPACDLTVRNTSETKAVHVIADEDSATWTPLYPFLARKAEAQSPTASRQAAPKAVAFSPPKPPEAPGLQAYQTLQRQAALVLLDDDLPGPLTPELDCDEGVPQLYLEPVASHSSITYVPPAAAPPLCDGSMVSAFSAAANQGFSDVEDDSAAEEADGLGQQGDSPRSVTRSSTTNASLPLPPKGSSLVNALSKQLQLELLSQLSGFSGRGRENSAPVGL